MTRFLAPKEQVPWPSDPFVSPHPFSADASETTYCIVLCVDVQMTRCRCTEHSNVRKTSTLCCHCRCTMCGGRREEDDPNGQSMKTVVCVRCRATTHVDCIPRESELMPLAGGKPAAFCCSAFCLFDCSVEANRCFLPDVSATLEQKFERAWARYIATATPAKDSAAKDALRELHHRRVYLDLRFLCWRDYFVMAQHRTPLSQRFQCLPPQWSIADRVLWSDAMSPEGKARQLCHLKPSHHPVGSVVVVPNHELMGEQVCQAAEGKPFAVPVSPWNRDLRERTKRLFNADEMPLVGEGKRERETE